MGHSTSILALKKGISFKWKIFFISSSLINYYIDFTISFYFSFKYLFFLLRYKYYNIFKKNKIFFSHLSMSKFQKNTLFIKISILDFNFIKFFFYFYKNIQYKFYTFFGRYLFYKNIKKYYYFNNRNNWNHNNNLKKKDYKNF